MVLVNRIYLIFNYVQLLVDTYDINRIFKLYYSVLLSYFDSDIFGSWQKKCKFAICIVCSTKLQIQINGCSTSQA